MLKFSREHLARVTDVLRRRMGAVDVTVATEQEDRFHGIDYWATLSGTNRVSVDLKVRQENYGDLLLEILSDTDRLKPGWTIDRTKRTDYILYLWPGSDSLVPYPPLRTVTLAKRAEWKVMYRTVVATSDEHSWRTTSLAVPDRVVWDAIASRMSSAVVDDDPRPTCPECGAKALLVEPELFDESVLRCRCQNHEWLERAA